MPACRSRSRRRRWGGGRLRHGREQGDRVVVWEWIKDREDEAQLHRLSEGDVG